MKKIIGLFAFLALFVSTACAQMDKSNRPSPPAVAEGMIGETEVRIDYSQPAVKERKIWGELVPYGKIWRTGANEATTIEFSKDVMIEGQELKAGKYALFTIPTEGAWTFIFNTEADQWGSYNHKEDKDVLRVEVRPAESEEMMERMTFKIQDEKVHLFWDKLHVAFEVE
ncbi:MAG: DUF2911 domain-containing protein [Bacteroidota bacterium]